MESAEQSWGWCGLAAVDEDVRGFALLCPSFKVPRGSAQSGGPLVENAATLMFLEVVGADTYDDPIAAELVRQCLTQLARRRVRALECFGTTRTATGELPPAEWLADHGFELVRPDPLRPKYRVDIDRTITVWDHLRGLWRRVGPSLVPGQPEPVTRADT